MDEQVNIMIVEDDRIIAEDIRLAVLQAGYFVSDMVASGEDALLAITAHRPDLVLMDIFLKGEMDGITAAELIKKNCGIPFIYLTSHSDAQTIKRAKATGPFGYLIKPFVERELEVAIEMALYKHKMEQEREQLIIELREALTRVKTLEGLLPICAWCKKIRTDDGYWEQLEGYIQKHSNAQFSHGICNECYQKQCDKLG
ncbi:MAG: histidine kinase [Deltaproteobacteria bacterium RIFOXYD12_FULL_50_9]|nr:MAG: histidine kinase [Deltaproteobacteria bacterium RIFOXYD12_FULL_50_9]